MKLTVFQSEKGDCLLLTSKDESRRVLIDGGMKPSYQEFVAPTLGELAAEGHKLDLVYLSHIDQDHIAGVLQLMDDHVAWRVHDFQLGNGNSDLSVLKAVIDSRLADVPFRATHPQAAGRFKLWFNSSESASKKPDAKKHMRAVREMVEDRQAGSGGRMTTAFLQGDRASFDLPV